MTRFGAAQNLTPSIATMNWTRILVGGLSAGFVINMTNLMKDVTLPGFGREWGMALADCGIDMRTKSAVFTLLGLAALAFLSGVAAIWLYAAIRPRFGPGMTTAIYAGLFAWALGYVYPLVGGATLGLFPWRLVFLSSSLTLGQFVLATVVGARVYRE